MRCPVCDYNGTGGPSDHEPWCPAFMRGAVDLEGEQQLPFGDADADADAARFADWLTRHGEGGRLARKAQHV